MNILDPIKTNQVSGLWLATFGDYDLDDPIGTGKTEAEAIDDLKEQVDQDSLQHGYLVGEFERLAKLTKDFDGFTSDTLQTLVVRHKSRT